MSRTHYPNPQDIIFLEADVNYTIFHLRNGRKIMSSSTLKRHGEREAHCHFLRINRHLLINPEFIQKIISNGKQKRVQLSNGLDYEVSRRRKGVLECINKQHIVIQ